VRQGELGGLSANLTHNSCSEDSALVRRASRSPKQLSVMGRIAQGLARHRMRSPIQTSCSFRRVDKQPVYRTGILESGLGSGGLEFGNEPVAAGPPRQLARRVGRSFIVGIGRYAVHLLIAAPERDPCGTGLTAIACYTAPK
jgi:hypothetical protein